jgi:lipoprotein-releasing system ATP-binding protein
MNDIVVKTSGIEKYYGSGSSKIKVLNNINIEIKRGEIVSIVGPSGAGKSTLLNLIGCLDTFQNGELYLIERNISKLTVDAMSYLRNSHIGFIFQLHNLLPEFTALENIMMPLLIRRVNKNIAKEEALRYLVRFNLTERADHLPSMMSGGECQRIAVARALIGKPDIILADEPTGSLDSANSSNLIDIMFGFADENKTTIMIVTHDQEIASRTGRTIHLKDGGIID